MKFDNLLVDVAVDGDTLNLLSFGHALEDIFKKSSQCPNTKCKYLYKEFEFHCPKMYFLKLSLHI